MMEKRKPRRILWRGLPRRSARTSFFVPSEWGAMKPLVTYVEAAFEATKLEAYRALFEVREVNVAVYLGKASGGIRRGARILTGENRGNRAFLFLLRFLRLLLLISSGCFHKLAPSRPVRCPPAGRTVAGSRVESRRGGRDAGRAFGRSRTH